MSGQMVSARERGVRGGSTNIGRPACPRAAECISYAREIPCALCPALSARRCALPPRFCKILQRWGRVCPRPSPSLGCPLYLFPPIPPLPCLFSFFFEADLCQCRVPVVG